MSDRRKASLYKEVDIETRVSTASPYELINMLFEGALTNISAAKGAVQRNDTADKCRKISHTLDIISSLRDCLDKNSQHELPYNLDRLYEYMQNQLLRANLDNDIAILDEISELIGTIKSGWEGIEE